ncbi:helix-turn-helix domain-containing protein [Bacillus haynesii]|uniref:helix-turn-helix domain-containing protein n=1 Tax=Bacillus haynesii TaxID=1925021 RepID=UPI003BF4CF7F
MSECDQGIDSIKKIAKEFDVHFRTIRDWRTLYEMTEEAILERSKSQKFYSSN